MADAKSLYPDLLDTEGWFDSPYSYQPMIDSFGTVLLQVDDNDYQGDTRVLYGDGVSYGLLVFGWGSCSGCDALQATSGYDDLQNLIDSIENSIVWRSKVDTLDYLKTHDWEGDWSWYGDETKEFVAKAIELLEGESHHG